MLISRGLSPTPPPPRPGWSWQQCWRGHTEVTLGANMPHARHGHCQTTPGRYRQELTLRACTAPAPTSVTGGTWGERPPPALPRSSAACRVLVSHPFENRESAWDSPQETATHMPLASAQHSYHRDPRPHPSSPHPGVSVYMNSGLHGALFLVKHFLQAKMPQRREEHQPPSSLRSSIIKMAPTVFSPALRGSTSGSSPAPRDFSPACPQVCLPHDTCL